jgi:hypothetical protein
LSRAGAVDSRTKGGLLETVFAGFLREASVLDLKVGEARADLLLTRHDEGDVGVNVLRRDGALDVVVLK